MKLRENQKGFSLVELIIIIAILAIVSGAITGLSGMLRGKYAKQACSMFDSALASTRVDTLAHSKGASASNPDVYVRIYIGSDGLIWLDSVNKASDPTNPKVISKQIGRNGRVSVKAYADDGSELVLDTSNEIVIAFDRKDGSFLKTCGGTKNWKKIGFYQSGMCYYMELVPLTGKFGMRAE